jgi:AraC family transcriptional regulator
MNPITPVKNILPSQPSKTVIATQDRDCWKGVALLQHEFTSEFSTPMPAHNECRVAYFSKGKNRLIQKRGGKIHEGRAFAGMSLIVPKGHDAVYEGEAMNNISLRVPHELMARGADEIGNRTEANYEIINTFEVCDVTIGHLTNLLLIELNQPGHPAQALITDAISVAFATHLLRSYNAFDIQTHHISRLGSHALSRVICYIEDHTGATIRLDELANIAGVSRFHFSRLFKSTIGISPMSYVEQSRIRKAQELIQSGEATLAEVALIAGFADQSHFTRRFQIHTGCTPAVFARHKGIRVVR